MQGNVSPSARLVGRRCLLEPIDEIFEAARLLSEAVDAHLAGDRSHTETLLRAADIPAVRAWTDSIWGKQRPEILQIRPVPNVPPILPKDRRLTQRMPTAQEEATLIGRCGYNCVFCGIPLIHKRVRQRIVRAYPNVPIWGKTNKAQHAAFQAMWLQLDHVLPHARGGDNSIENLIVTCAPCNFGRMNYALDEMGLADPRSRPLEKTSWDGLERFK